MKATLVVLIDAVVAGADPIAVVVDQSVIESEKLQSAVDVQQRRKSLLQFVRQCFVKNFTELHQSGPRLFVVFALDLIDALVWRRLVSEVCEAPARAGTARHLPTRAFRCAKPVLNKIFVEL